MSARPARGNPPRTHTGGPRTMIRTCVLIITLSLLFVTDAIAQQAPPPGREPDRAVKGLLTATAGTGFWARFAQPVREGQAVSIFAHSGNEEVGTARIAWASAVEPFEAYVVDVRPGAPIHARTTGETPYMRLTGDKLSWYSQTDLP